MPTSGAGGIASPAEPFCGGLPLSEWRLDWGWTRLQLLQPLSYRNISFCDRACGSAHLTKIEMTFSRALARDRTTDILNCLKKTVKCRNYPLTWVSHGEPGGSTSLQWNEFERIVSTLEPSRVARVLDEVNEDLRKSLLHGEAFGRADVFPLCRLVTFMGLVKSPARVRKKDDEDKPIPVAWKSISDDINSFVKNTCPSPLGSTSKNLLFDNFTDQKLKVFASLGHPVAGSPDRRFYVTILLYLFRQWCEGHFEARLFRSLASRSDRNSPVRAIQSLAASLQHAVPFAGELETRQVEVPFGVLEGNDLKFRTYFQEFATPKRPRPGTGTESEPQTPPRVLQLQFIIYRPMATDASKIVRSYLSVFSRTTPTGTSPDLNFMHYFRPPYDGQRAKIATGKVVPLNNAFYLIGGQRTEGRNKTKPYDTAKVMAFDFASVDKLHPLVPMIALSSRNDGRPIITRAIARVTPFDYSSEATYAPIRHADLEKALLAECKRERDYIDAHPLLEEQEKERIFNSYPLPLRAPPENMGKSDDPEKMEAQMRIRNLAIQILKKSSNSPDPSTGISVPSGYRKSDRSLTKAELNATVEASLLQYVDAKAEAYNIWDDTLFGPVTLGS